MSPAAIKFLMFPPVTIVNWFVVPFDQQRGSLNVIEEYEKTMINLWRPFILYRHKVQLQWISIRHIWPPLTSLFTNKHSTDTILLLCWGMRPFALIVREGRDKSSVIIRDFIAIACGQVWADNRDTCLIANHSISLHQSPYIRFGHAYYRQQVRLKKYHDRTRPTNNNTLN